MPTFCTTEKKFLYTLKTLLQVWYKNVQRNLYFTCVWSDALYGLVKMNMKYVRKEIRLYNILSNKLEELTHFDETEYLYEKYLHLFEKNEEKKQNSV